MQEGLLDLERISEQPLSGTRVWSDAIRESSLRIEDFFVAGAEIQGSKGHGKGGSRRRNTSSISTPWS